jgi:uncharacterized membrane protein
VFALALFAAFLWTLQSWWRWTHFRYGTFDLAFYVQALDGFSHGRNRSSLLNVQPFGNHADFIILLIWPLFALFKHPMTLVIVQNVALSLCLPLGWKIAREMGWSPRQAFWLSLLLLVNPVLTFVATHEFHPEAFAAPLWLSIFYGWQTRNLRWFWLSLILLLSCKENLGLIVGCWCFTKLLERPPKEELWKWSLLPGLFTAAWMAIYLFWLGPKWNGGNVDFGALYSHLHEKGFVEGASWVLSSSWRGNILWALLLPMLLLPLRRPLTLLPALPILFQHWLSWRSSEWTIYYHYAAPLLPLFWIATLESLKPGNSLGKKWYRTVPCYLVLANVVCFLAVDAPSRFLAPFFEKDPQLFLKRGIVAEVPEKASVLAPLPFQSHLAAREEIYSLHLVLKGLKTLSRHRYAPPPPTDVVIADYTDQATFDSGSGYYHPAMQMNNGEVVPSSDVLLHRFLAQVSWEVNSVGSLTVWTRVPPRVAVPSASPAPLRAGVVDPLTDLISLSSSQENGRAQVVSAWQYRGERQEIPWLTVVATNITTGEKRLLTRGLCAPEGKADGSVWRDVWSLPEEMDLADWQLLAVFEDHATRSYTGRVPGADERFVANIPRSTTAE